MCNRCKTFSFISAICPTIKLHEWIIFFSRPFKTIFCYNCTIIYTFFPTYICTSCCTTFSRNISWCFGYTGTRKKIEIFRPWTSLRSIKKVWGNISIKFHTPARLNARTWNRYGRPGNKPATIQSRSRPR